MTQTDMSLSAGVYLPTLQLIIYHSYLCNLSYSTSTPVHLNLSTSTIIRCRQDIPADNERMLTLCSVSCHDAAAVNQHSLTCTHHIQVHQQ